MCPISQSVLSHIFLSALYFPRLVRRVKNKELWSVSCRCIATSGATYGRTSVRSTDSFSFSIRFSRRVKVRTWTRFLGSVSNLTKLILSWARSNSSLKSAAILSSSAVSACHCTMRKQRLMGKSRIEKSEMEFTLLPPVLSIMFFLA